MAKVKITVKVPSGSAFLGAALAGLADRINLSLGRLAGRLPTLVRPILEQGILTSPEAVSLISGRLRHELGVVDPVPVVNEVAARVAAGVRAKSLGARYAAGNITGGVRLEVLKSDLSEVIEVPGGEFVSEGRFRIPWLQWLTAEGDQVLVLEHHFEGVTSNRSRTGVGLMLPGGSWRVPPEFSGTPDNNWLTRAAIRVAPAIQRLVAEELLRDL